MAQREDAAAQVEALVALPGMAGALDNDQFRRFLDQVPLAIVVAELADEERITYANPEFARVTGHEPEAIIGVSWSAIGGMPQDGAGPPLGTALVEASDYLGSFTLVRPDGTDSTVDAFSNVIESDAGVPAYRLAVLVDVAVRHGQAAELAEELRGKDALLREIQHRVKNNLQLVTALIRIEARRAEGQKAGGAFDMLAGRIQAIQGLYALLAEKPGEDRVDLGVYLGDIASSVMRAHAEEGIRLDLKVDSFPVTVNVAMPTGLLVNEVLTNSLKYAFLGRQGGTISLTCVADQQNCRITVADDGTGLPEGVEWPRSGKLGALLLQSLRQNGAADVVVNSTPGQGMRVEMRFRRADSAPDPAAAG